MTDSLPTIDNVKDIFLSTTLLPWLVSGIVIIGLVLRWRRQKSPAPIPPNLQPIPLRRVSSSNIIKKNTNQVMTRERATSFDFFGMNHGQPPLRGRNNSLGALSEFRMGSNRERTSSADQIFGRNGSATFSRSNSLDAPGPMFEQEGCIYDEFGLVNLSFNVTYHGPSVTSLKYSAMTPPTSWKEASRRILPQDVMIKLKRDIILNIASATLLIQQESEQNQRRRIKNQVMELPTEQFSTHAVPPVEGGVLNLYVKESPKEEWMEYTFESARSAAQFQLDLISYHVCGDVLRNMYQVLSLVHQGSIAHRGQEFVLHDTLMASVEEQGGDSDGDNEGAQKHILPATAMAGVAWDDAMRALSSIPSVRIALERLWLHHRGHAFSSGGNRKKAASTTINKDPMPSPNDSLTEEYEDKRLLLGPVDFFRLFVPMLPETAVPHSETRKGRMEQLLRWRKRAARAAVLVRSYVMARRVVNQGWVLPHDKPSSIKPLTRRLAYDDNEDNKRRDSASENEYYEATVSRDVLCNVRAADYFGKSLAQGLSGLSPYQAYSMVGMHIFRLPTENIDDHPLNPGNDPVLAIPSLYNLIKSNPQLDFFVTVFFAKARGAAVVCCYVRSLPKEVDLKFDTVMNRFINGNEELRNRKLHLTVQLCADVGLSHTGWAVLRTLSALLSLTRKGRESPVSLESTGDRLPFPGIRLSNYTKSRHFGGALQTDPTLPKNYAAVNAYFDSKHMPNLIARLLFDHLENGAISQNISDFTFVVEGEQEDEVPERALCTIRMVHVDSESVAWPVPCTAKGIRVQTKNNDQQPLRLSAIVTQTISDMVQRMGSPLNSTRIALPAVETMEERSNEDEEEFPNFFDDNNTTSDDPFSRAINQICEVLADAKVPVRVDQIKKKRKNNNNTSLLRRDFSSGRNDVVPQNVLSIYNRQDIKRFFQSSGCDIRTTALRVVESASWRGITFPIDTRKCRIELQNGQFFQQGHDKEGNPLFYFRNLCLGPWRKDDDAVISAVLHRFDHTLQKISAVNPEVRCTVIILMGRPYNSTGMSSVDEVDSITSNQQEQQQDHNNSSVDNDSIVSEGGTLGDNKSIGTIGEQSYFGGKAPSLSRANPRIDPGETWHQHTSKALIHRLIDILLYHYPERLAKALIVPGRGNRSYFRNSVGGRILLPSVIDSTITRGRVKFLRNSAELKEFVAESELVDIVGGSCLISFAAFEC